MGSGALLEGMAWGHHGFAPWEPESVPASNAQTPVFGRVCRGEQPICREPEGVPQIISIIFFFLGNYGL